MRQVISCCFTLRNYFSLSESDSGLTSSSNRVHGPRNCNQEGSRTASRFAIQVDRDGRETAAGTEAEQLDVSQSRSTEQAVPAPRRQQKKQRPDEKKISIRRLPQGTVRDLILLTMWVLSPTIVVIFVQCIDCSGWAFWLMGCCLQISPCLYH